MHLPRFQHLRPSSVREAAALLAQHGPAARLAAGGTDLLPRMKYGLEKPVLLVSLRGIAPRPPRCGDALALDAVTPLASLARSPEVRRAAPVLADAALSVASHQVRNMGTLGGNLCLDARCLYFNQGHDFQFVEPCLKRGGDLCYFAPRSKKCWAVFSGDTAPALLCLDAVVSVREPDAKREIPLEALYSGDAAAPVSLGPAEIVEEIVVPVAQRAQAFRKHSRRGGVEFSGLTVAVALDLEGATCREARIAVGSVAGAPLRARKAEAALVGLDVTKEASLRAASREAAAEIRPVAHHGYSAGYLRECLEVETFRALVSATGRPT